MIRRRALISAPAVFLFPRIALGADPWQAVRDRAAALEQLHSILVAQDGETVLAAHLRGPGLDRPANVKSVSKTIVATLTGISIARGEVPGLDATLGATAPRLVPGGADPRVRTITIENLLTMQTGLERTSGRNYGAWVSSRDWVADALSRPFVDTPGGRMLYSTGSYHVLGAVLSEASGESLLQLARRRLGDPLDIAFPLWVADPQGRYLGGNDMAASPRGLLRFAEMVRRDGESDGRRVVPEAWIRDSARPRTRSQYSGLQYGLGWFLGGRGRNRIMLARGYGGQIVAVMPAERLSIVITSDPTRPARSDGYFGDLMTLIEEHVLPAARSA